MFDVFLYGTSNTGLDSNEVGYAKFSVFSKEQYAYSGYWINFLGHDNMSDNIAYKYDENGGDFSSGLFEVWVKSIHKYGRPYVSVTQNSGFEIEVTNIFEQGEKPDGGATLSLASDWVWNK